MSQRISPWWYSISLVLAVLAVVAGGVAVGRSARPAVAASVNAVDGYVAFAPGRRISVDLRAGQTRLLFASADPGALSSRGWWCDAQPAPGSSALPHTWRLRPGDTVSLSLPSGRWWLLGKVQSSIDGAVVVTCQDTSSGSVADLRFAITPNLDGATYRTSLQDAGIAVAFTLLGLLLAGVAGIVVLAIRLSGPPVRPGSTR
jgi:hypothetical protein